MPKKVEITCDICGEDDDCLAFVRDDCLMGEIWNQKVYYCQDCRSTIYRFIEIFDKAKREKHFNDLRYINEILWHRENRADGEFLTMNQVNAKFSKPV